MGQVPIFYIVVGGLIFAQATNDSMDLDFDSTPHKSEGLRVRQVSTFDLGRDSYNEYVLYLNGEDPTSRYIMRQFNMTYLPLIERIEQINKEKSYGR